MRIRLGLVLVLVLGVLSVACSGASSPTGTVPERAADGRSNSETSAASAPTAIGDVVGAPSPSVEGAQERATPDANVPEAMARELSVLATLDEAALRARVDFEAEARTRRAMSLGDASAAPVGSTPLSPLRAAGSLGALLRAGDACHAVYVEGELRIDFPPAMDDTRPENAAEISAVHDLLYAGTSITAYCGERALYALVVKQGSGPLRVLAWQDLSHAESGNR